MVEKWRKRPVVIETVQWDGENIDEVLDFIGAVGYHEIGSDELYIDTLEGRMHASINDYVIKGVQDEFYACKPDIFVATYEPAD